jgi:DNA repair protein RadA/Sms
MARSASAAGPAFLCGECGWTSPQWVGRCGGCREWGSVSEVPRSWRAPHRAASARGGRSVSRPASASPFSREDQVSGASSPTRVAQRLTDVATEGAAAIPTGVVELDRVLGGGLVPGGVVLVSGEPGIGKSTLLLDVAARAGTDARPSLYVTAEESAGQVRRRADRMGIDTAGLYLAAQTSLEAVLDALMEISPGMLILDSVQTMSTASAEGVPGGVSQVRQLTAEVAEAARARGMTTILVGHVTKDGSVAGPRTLEHLVDVVLSFEGEHDASLRLLRALKNRYGPTDEVGYFQMSGEGLDSCPDPSGLFLSSLAADLPGTCRTVVLHGRRPLAVEVQALVAGFTGGVASRGAAEARGSDGSARVTATGLDRARLAMVLAVLERRGGVRLGAEIHAAILGGLRITDPAGDLAIAMAVAGSAVGTAVPRGVTAIGEIGLTGEIQAVPRLEQRVAEALRRGAPAVLAPVGAPSVSVEGHRRRPIEVATVSDAVAAWTALDGARRSVG